MYDHFHNVPRPANEAVFECWTTIAAISQLTSTVRLGQMVGCNSYRNPALLAKITANIDVISGGRLDWGIGAGWYEQEYRAYGYEFPKPKRSDRHARRDGADRAGRCGPSPRRRSRGKHYEIRGRTATRSRSSSRTRRSGSAAAASSSRLRTVAKYADCSNFGGPPEQWAHKRDVLREHCAKVGRDPDEIRMTWSPELFIRETEAEVEAAGSLAVWGQPADEWRANNLVGTPEQVAEKMRDYVDARLSRVRAVVRRLSGHRDAGAVSRPR